MHLTNRPAKGTINTPFGPRPKPTPSSPAIHYGQDYGWGGGDTIVAAAPGRVKGYAFSGAYGNRLVIDHGDGFETWYCHLTRNSVPVGVQVAGGQEVAVMGATGNVVGKHLHFEVRRNGVAVDPAPYFVAASTATVTASALPLKPKLYIPQGEEDMTAPIYAKGDKDDTVYALYVNAGDANSANGFAGAVYSGRRKVSRGEFLIVEQIGFPHEKQKAIVKIAQADFDKINKLAGSE